MKYSEFLRANPSLSDSHSTRKMFLFPFENFIMSWGFSNIPPAIIFPTPNSNVPNWFSPIRDFFFSSGLRRSLFFVKSSAASYGSISVTVFRLKDLVLSIN